MQRLHNHAFYLYGVIVGLAIREALVDTGPHVFIPSNVAPWKIHLEALRLIVFLATIGCFYFGAGVYFDKVHLGESSTNYSKKSYGLDFVMGLIHFLFFFAWALTLTNHSRNSLGISPFYGFLSAVFLYDLVWLIANIRFDAAHEIKMWAVMCLIVWCLATGLFFTVRAITNNDVLAEEISLGLYACYLVGDAVELFSGKPFFLTLLQLLLPQNTRLT